MLAISEVTTKNLVIASKYWLFIIRLSESQFSLCDCQSEGQRETDKEKDSLLIKVFFLVWEGMGIMVAATASDAIFIVIHP